MKVRRPIMRCNLCEREDIPEEEMGQAYCLLCLRDLGEFRRAFKREFGRWPTIAEFKKDDDEGSSQYQS